MPISQATAQRAREREHESKMRRLRETTARGGHKSLRIFVGGRATRGRGSWSKTGRQVGLLVKIHSGGAAGDAYSERSKDAQFLATNMLGQIAQQRQVEWALDAARHPRVNPTNMAVHVSLSRPAGADLTQAQWAKTCQVFLKKIDAEGCNFAVTRHKNTEHDHVHLVFSRAKPDGKLVSMSNNRWAWRQACREVERELGLQVPDRPAERQAVPTPTSDRLVSAQRRAARRDTPDPWLDPAQIREALSQSATPEIFTQNLAKVGIEVKPAKRPSDGEVVGLMFRRQGAQEHLAGSSISREFSLPKIQAQIELNRQMLQKQEQQIQFQRQRQALEQQRIAIQSQQVTRHRG